MNYLAFFSLQQASSSPEEKHHRSVRVALSSSPSPVSSTILESSALKPEPMVEGLSQHLSGLQMFNESMSPTTTSVQASPSQPASSIIIMKHDRRSVPVIMQTQALDEDNNTNVEDKSVKEVGDPISTKLTTNGHNDNKKVDNVVYGELVQWMPAPRREGRRRSRYQLVRRAEPSGIKKSKHYSVNQPSLSEAIQDKKQHSISFTLSRSQAIIVEYQRDEDTDMFQIGRSSESPIDFVVIDSTLYNDTNNNHHNNNSHAHKLNETCSPQVPFSLFPPSCPPSKSIQQSTISRFACRILIDRHPPHTARIYAAGFDSSRNIFLGEKATKWQAEGEIDGLTTNGILMMHPRTMYVTRLTPDGAQLDSTAKTNETSAAGVWREVSVCGEIYSVRETRSSSQRGVRMENETNILQDGTLIDLCGATLVWRSADGLARSPSRKHLEEMIDQLNASRPQCPVGLNTLQIPRKSASLGSADDKQPYVYLNCGHVQGYHDWGQVNKRSNSRVCPMCFKTGSIVKLSMGIEASFCTSSGTPTYAFNPCGHMASDATVKYWSQVLIPHGTNGFHAMCPFCATPLLGESGYVKLIFQ